ncbi:MAG: hypothetical protein ACYCPO_01200 [Acidobacteriaceae bacterium]
MPAFSSRGAPVLEAISFGREDRADRLRRKPEQIAFIPEEVDALNGLGQVNRELARELGRRCAEQRIATVGQDATIIESHKREALRIYKCEPGYQPMLAVWAEMDAVLADEFRDGNVPALPETVTSFYCRGDSASYKNKSGLRSEVKYFSCFPIHKNALGCRNHG